MNQHEKYMNRCLQLAVLGAGTVAPNPMVGAVLVYNDRIIGEGYHKVFGKAHAEVNCIDAVAASDRHLIPQSDLYVSLEPCSHFGKTPPCVDLIIKNKIGRVIIACRDPFPAVNGSGIEKLQAAGVTVVTGVAENAAKEMNRRFFTFHQQRRPYVLLKWAQTADGIIGSLNKERLMISGELTNRIVHRWRSEEAAILVGANTVEKDNPSLTTRLWPGRNPVRIVIDPGLKLPEDMNIFDAESSTYVYNCIRKDKSGTVSHMLIDEQIDLLPQILTSMYNVGLQSVIVEGGRVTLQSFIESGLWDEARVITNPHLFAGNGISAPRLSHFTHVNTREAGSDRIDYFRNKNIAH
jgi:diaminohydroxyphosphoribosylaminopyrimidine deaminase/5-amino-6-(5-phosphoribosylamino)uracil reductase